ncbi:MAG: serine/threonine protein kinase [Polyangiaceae bacterium]|nr:serine/threonine protein kinase [Polyangiaceae bacterium]
MESALPPGPLRKGDAVGKYEIVAYLASGGMAELYLARVRGIEGFEKVVALKRILPKLALDPEVVSMFLDEARLAAALHHPNLAQIYDVGREGGSYFFTMEYVHGEDLHTVVQRAARQRRGLSLSSALYIVSQVAAGLHHAHDKRGADGQPLGTVHRDVSPSNVMISFDGAVKIVDFGVAKALARRTKTLSGNIKGKLGYLSPEQARGEEIDRRSDVYALGILLFELTTGTRLYDQAHDYAVLSALFTQDAPLPSSRRADYPPELEAIVEKALRRTPDLRWATAEELQLAIEAFAREQKLPLSAVALGRFMREVVGERADPTATLAVAATGTDPGSRRSAAPETLAGATSRRAIPLERGVGRSVWLIAGAVLAVGGVTLALGLAGESTPPASPTAALPSAPRALPASATRASAAATAAASLGAPPPSSPASVASPSALAASGPSALAGGSARPPSAAVLPPAPRPSGSVVQAKKDGASSPGWNPGSVLPPVVEDTKK